MALFDWLKNMFSREAADVKFAAFTLSACGLVRKENQDSVLSLPETGIFCVADGMGGGKEGALASQWVCESLAKAVRNVSFDTLGGEARIRFLGDALQEVNDRVRAHAKEQGHRSMGSTVALLVPNPLERMHPYVAHAGDSRVYRMRRGELRLLTSDHTVGGELSRKTASRREAEDLGSRGNPLSHILTRAVGTEFKVRPEWQTVDLKIGDRILLCTDGVHDMLSDEEIAVAMRGRRTPEEIAQRLEAGIVAAGAGDNYSLICVEVRRR